MTTKITTIPMLADYANELQMVADSFRESVYATSSDLRAKIDTLTDKYEYLAAIARSLDLDYIETNLHRLKK
jgi:cell division protein FtsB